MIDKNIKSRIIHKHDTAENWVKAINFIPKQAEIIVYDIDSTYTYERFKIGDGITKVNDLPFAIDGPLNHMREQGAFDGEDGYTPIRGTDYWTYEDKAEIKAYVDEVVGNMETGVVLPTLTNEGTAADVLEGKEFIDSSGNIVVGTMSLDDELTAQAQLIADIQAGLEGKTGGGGSGSSENDALLKGVLEHTIVTAVIPNIVTSLGDYVFANCTTLTSISMPETITSIGYRTFYSCTGLTSVTIPSSVTKFSNQTFANCSNLTSVTCYAATPPTIGAATFPSNVTAIYVPADSVDTYKSATNWSAYASIIFAI